MSKANATIEDVAAAAGVSVATVSRALRDLPNVAPATRQKVRAVATELSYVSNPSAARLAAGRTGTVAVVVPRLDTWYFSGVVAAIEAVLKPKNVDMLLYAVGSEEDRVSFFAGRGAWWQRSDALVMVDVALGPESASRLAANGARIVTVSGVTDYFSSVTLDERAASVQATQHLIDRGHTRIGMLYHEQLAPGFKVPMARLEGFRRAKAAAGLDLDPDLERAVPSSVQGGAEAAAGLLDLPEPPTAVFAMCDDLAFGVITELRSRGLSAPNDVAVVGFDDHELARVLGLTTIRQPVDVVGALAGQAVLEAMTSTNVTHHVVETELVIRSTT